MLCIDTSSFISFLEGEEGEDIDFVDQAFSDKIGVLAPVTLSELLSDPKLETTIRNLILQLPILNILNGYWERAGLLRAKVLHRERKAKFADTLIAQSCLDHNATLVTRDDDFKVFREVAGLKLF